ncbi:MAG: glycoside hydrolase N-terminal domain-containing protein [Rikenellaceae bacterium]
MKRLILTLSLAVIALSVVAQTTTVPQEAWKRQEDGKTHIISSRPAAKWEEGLVSGNGSTGIMVLGNPNNERIVVNHEKCWSFSKDYLKESPELRPAVDKSRKIAKKGNFGMAAFGLINDMSRWNLENFPKEQLSVGWGALDQNGGGRHVHAAFNIDWESSEESKYDSYFREMVLDDAEVNVYWGDDKGAWERSAFVSRTDDVIAWKMSAPKKGTINGKFSLSNIENMLKAEVGEVEIDYKDNQLYYYLSYAHTAGLPKYMGYHAVGRIINKGGTIVSDNDGIVVEGAKELLVLMRFEFLDDIKDRNKSALSAEVAKIPANYATLSKNNDPVQSDLMNRVDIDLNTGKAYKRTTEQIVSRAQEEGMTAEMLDLLHDLGRYALICSSGEFPAALMGVWGGDWTAAWGGHYTFDSNMELAISAASTGNLPEAMKSFTNLMETCFEDWEYNARKIFDCRGYLAGMGSAWYPTSGRTNSMWFSITGNAAWLSAYYEEYYSCTGDEKFLKEKQIPLLENIALFYEDYLEGMEHTDGKYLFFPSISPENIADKLPNSDLRSYIAPNPTSEIAMCKFALTNLVRYSKKLGINGDKIGKWEEMISKLPDYLIDENGALAEWSYPEVEASYTNKTAAQYFGVYPGTEIGKYETPELYKAAQTALNYRVTEPTKISGHGMLHDCFVAARLRMTDSFWKRLDVFPKTGFFYNSLLTAHFANQAIFNLDSSLALPAIIVEMMVSSRIGEINLLPVVDFEKLPKGSAKGILAKGAICVDKLEWNDGEVVVWLTSKTDQSIELSLPKAIKGAESEKSSCEVTSSSRGNNWKKVSLRAGETAMVKISM